MLVFRKMFDPSVDPNDDMCRLHAVLGKLEIVISLADWF